MGDAVRLSRRQFISAAPLAAAALPMAFAGGAPSALAQHSGSDPEGEPPETCKVEIQWGKIVGASRTVPTLQVVVNPLLRRGSPIHDRVFHLLHGLGADYVRYVPWHPYPRLAVAELEPPANGKTSWDFSLLDPMMEDFMTATQGHPVIVNFSTIPEWMFRTPKPVPFPSDPNQVDWSYEQGTELRDPSMKEVADYYARLVSWYTQGGFRDEYGQEHASGHHYKIDYWEVLNEIDFEHRMTPRFYTALYDEIVSAIHKVESRMKFVGLALAGTSPNTRLAADPSKYFEYFLNPKNHKPGIPLDMISYHCYASPAADEPISAAEYTFVDQADHFLDEVRYIEAIRRRLSPGTRTTTDEVGTLLPNDSTQSKPGQATKPIPDIYWSLSGAFYAYIFAQLIHSEIDIVGESQLVGYPTQFPSVSMVDWKTGAPNARFRVLELLHANVFPGDKLAESNSSVPHVYAQGLVSAAGERKVLLINQRSHSIEVTVSGAAGGKVECVDLSTRGGPPARVRFSKNTLSIGGFGVAIATL